MPHIESIRVPVECREAASRAEAYLSDHGITAIEEEDFHVIRIHGRKSEMNNDGSRRTVVTKKWIDAMGDEITDLKVFWKLADHESANRLPFGVWRVRMAHYAPRGPLRLQEIANGCQLDMAPRFDADGANIIGIIPVVNLGIQEQRHFGKGLLARDRAGSPRRHKQARERRKFRPSPMSDL